MPPPLTPGIKVMKNSIIIPNELLKTNLKRGFIFSLEKLEVEEPDPVCRENRKTYDEEENKGKRLLPHCPILKTQKGTKQGNSSQNINISGSNL